MGIIETTLLTLRPLIELGGIDYDLTCRIKFDVRAVHRTRRGPLEVYSLAGVAASMARAFELILAGLPIRRASQVSASGVNHKEFLGVSNDPDAILLLKFCVDPKTEIGWISDSEDGAWFEDGARKKEAQEHHEAGGKEPAHGGPNNYSPHLVDGICGRAFDSLSLSAGRSSHCGLRGGFRFIC